MQIGDVAKKADTSIRTIRYYEELGLISEPERTAGRFRKYNNDDLNKILMIQRFQSLGLSLSEIRNLFTIRKRSTRGGEAAKQIYEFLHERSLELDQKIDRLKNMKSDIDVSKELIEKCFNCKRNVSRCKKNCNLTGKYEEAPKLFKAVL